MVIIYIIFNPLIYIAASMLCVCALNVWCVQIKWAAAFCSKKLDKFLHFKMILFLMYLILQTKNACYMYSLNQYFNTTLRHFTWWLHQPYLLPQILLHSSHHCFSALCKDAEYLDFCWNPFLNYVGMNWMLIFCTLIPEGILKFFFTFQIKLRISLKVYQQRVLSVGCKTKPAQNVYQNHLRWFIYKNKTYILVFEYKF